MLDRRPLRPSPRPRTSSITDVSGLRDGLLPEWRRTVTATIGAFVGASLGVAAAYATWTPPPSVGGWLATLMAWLLLALIHAGLTWWVFRRRSGDDLRRALRAAFPDRVAGGDGAHAPARPWFSSNGDAPSWSVTLSLLALMGVGALVLTPALRELSVFLALGVLLVVASLVNVVVMYAVQYALVDHARPALEFPGEQERSFEDYLYVSLGVQTMFGVSDVTVLTTRMRRIVNGHSVIAFVFNTVILAMLVSLLVAGL